LTLSTPAFEPEFHVIADDTHLLIGALMFEGMDQIDLTGPFEVLSRVPNSTFKFTQRQARPFAI
jgi:cyclohexyl-isocyanide hydratase